MAKEGIVEIEGKILALVVKMHFAMIFSLILSALWSLIWSHPLKWAWNYVMPDIFGLSTISYWQMFALYLVLTTLWKMNITTVKAKY